MRGALRIHLWSTRSTSLRPPPPKPPESGTMPGNHGLRLDDDQGFGPALPQPAEGNPEQPIEAIQFGPGLLPLEDGELLAKSDGFQGEFVMWQKKRPQVSHHRTGKGNHDSILVEGHLSPVRAVF